MSSLNQRRLREVTGDGTVEPSVRDSSVHDANPYLAGEVIGDRYRLTSEIGRGGMGVVWTAHSLVLGIDVAVKLIRADVAGPAWASRMAREAHAAARLGHPAMVRVFDFGWTNRGDPFLVMELVHGDTLARVIQREGRLPAIRAVQTLLPIADGLRVAHDRSIIHRDIKPDNILLSADTLGRLQPKLLDFGIAKVGQAQASGKLTQVGAVLGSPEYMSPEQARGLESVDGRTDVWSLGIALYELLTGKVPFDQPNYNALMHSIIHDPLPPLSTRGITDAGLGEILQRALAKDADERYGTMGEFGEALALWLYQHGIKEDLCGNSIRALWLDTPLSQVNSIAPDTSIPAPITPRRPQSIPTLADAPGDFGLPLVASQKRRWYVVAGVIAAVGFAIVLLPRNQQQETKPAALTAAAPAAPALSAVLPPPPAEPPAGKGAAEPTPTPDDGEAKEVRKETKSQDPAPSAKRRTARPVQKTGRAARDFGF